MADAFLDSSAVIELLFRDAVTRKKVEALVAPNARKLTSRYVVFEIARGYLSYLITLHNKCRVVGSLNRLLAYMREGQHIFRRYVRESMLGAYEDYIANWQQSGESLTAEKQLVEFHAWLANHIRNGWRKLNSSFPLLNPSGCKDSLSAITRRTDGDFAQPLPTDECGKAGACGLSRYLVEFRQDFEKLLTTLNAMPSPDGETTKRKASLTRLLGKQQADDFKKRDCYRCGDAIIAHEAPSAVDVVSKNAKHFESLCSALKKRFVGYS